MGTLELKDKPQLSFPEAHILIIEDDKVMGEGLTTILGAKGYKVTLASTGSEGLRLLTSGEEYDLVLLDVVMSEIDGWSILSRVRASPQTARLPIIITTGMSGEEFEIKLLAAGADDYLAKPFSINNLTAHINALLRRAALQSINPLTGLPGNRQIERFLQLCAREREKFWAAAYIDIDNFKAYNDAYGFLRGDDVLKAVAAMITGAAATYPHDCFTGNIGGDDFFMGFNRNAPRAEGAAVNEVRQVIEGLITEFGTTIEAFYSEHDRESGYLETEGRRGGVERYPLMSLSVAVVTNAQRVFDHPLEISNIFAALKRKAKAQPGSAIIFDKRRR